MAADSFLYQLAEAEAQLDSLTELLLQDDATDYEAAALGLRNAMVQLAHAAGSQPVPLSAVTAERLAQLARTLAQQRDQLARRATVVARSLAVVLPQKLPTYQAPGRRAGFSGAAPQIYSAPAR